MKDSRSDSGSTNTFVRCSLTTPSGCEIHCPCGAVFSPAGEDTQETCPQCSRIFHSGFNYEVEVISKISGMSLAVLSGQQPGTDLQKIASDEVLARFGAECGHSCNWDVRSYERAFFACDNE